MLKSPLLIKIIKLCSGLIFLIGISTSTVIFMMFQIQEKLLFFPEKLPVNYTFRFPWHFEEMYMKSGEVTLHALYFKIHNPKGCVLYFHGNAGSLRTWGFIAEDFLSRRYDIR
jgi:hypothetical protein